MVNQNYLPPKFIFSSDLGHFIFKIRIKVNKFDKCLKKYKILLETGGDYPLRHVEWRDEIPSIPPCGAAHGHS